MDKFRMMDLAYIRDGKVMHTGEAMMLACLLHAKGKTKRSYTELQEVQKIMKDKNIE